MKTLLFLSIFLFCQIQLPATEVTDDDFGTIFVPKYYGTNDPVLIEKIIENIKVNELKVYTWIGVDSEGNAWLFWKGLEQKAILGDIDPGTPPILAVNSFSGNTVSTGGNFITIIACFLGVDIDEAMPHY